MKTCLILILAIILLGTACAEPPMPTPAPQSPEDAIKAIQEVAGLPELPIQFTGMATMANSPSGSLQVLSYQDSQGRKFSVDPATDQVVEIDARAVTPDTFAKSPILSEAELKTKAEKLVRATTPKFDRLSSGLDYTPGTKSDIYFYDWRTKAQGPWYMPPFIEVAMNVSGELVGYINTVILPE